MIGPSLFRLTLLLSLTGLLLPLARPAPADESVPVLQWARSYGEVSRQADSSWLLRVDRCGQVWVSGTSKGVGTGDDVATIRYTPDGFRFGSSRYDSPAHGNDFPVGLELDPAGNAFVLVSTASVPTLIKYDPDGEESWTVRPSSTRYTFLLSPVALAVDSNGNAFLAFTGEDAMSQDAVIQKYSPEGDFLWEDSYSGVAGTTEWAQGIALEPEDQSPYLSAWASPLEGRSDFVTARFGPGGGVRWSETFSLTAQSEEIPRAIAAVPTGGVAVTGTYSDNGIHRWATVRYDREGQEVWQVIADPLHAQSEAIPFTIHGDRNGEVLVTGTADPVYRTVRYDEDGEVRWTHESPAPPNASLEGGVSSALGSDGRLCVSGSIVGGGNQHDVRVVCLDRAGLPLWTRTYDSGNGRSDSLFVRAVDGAGSAYLTGSSPSAFGDADYHTVKYNAAIPAPVIELYDLAPVANEVPSLPDANADVAELASSLFPLAHRSVPAVVADGVTLLLVRIPLPDGSRGEVHLDVGGGNDAGSLWAIDDLSLFDYTQQGGARDRAGPGPRELDVPIQVVDGEPWAFALYRSPRNFSESALDAGLAEREITLRACIPGRLGSGFDSLVYHRFNVVRPLVLLVHGLYSSPDAWWSFPLLRQSRSDVSRYQLPGSKPFHVGRLDFSSVKGGGGGAGESARELRPQIANAIRAWALQMNVAATQADVVAHSYGAMVAASLPQFDRDAPGTGPPDVNFRSAPSWGHGSLHKLIVFGGVLRGSAVVNHAALANRRTLGLIGSTLDTLGIALDNGAHRDMLIPSGPAGFLRKPSPFPAHAILGSGTIEHALPDERLIFGLLHYLDPPGGDYRSAGALTFENGTENFASWNRLTNYVFNLDYGADSASGELAPNYDLLVSARSMRGGIPAGAYSDRSHLGVPAGQLPHLRQVEHPAVSNRVEFLLNQSTTSTHFAPLPAFDPTLSGPEQKLASLADPGDLNRRFDGTLGPAGKGGPVLTTDAVDGRVAVGQSLSITISWPGRTLESALMFWPTRSGVASRLRSGKSPALDLIVEPIPSGRFRLAAVVRATDGQARQVSLELALQDTTQYTALTVVPESLTLDSGYPAPLTVYGQLKDGEWREITRSSATQVVSQNPNVAVVTPEVSVRSAGVGTTSVHVTVAGAGSVEVPVTVTAAPPSLPEAPESLTASAPTPAQVQLAWGHTGSTEDGFEIERRAGTGSFTLIAVTGVGTTTFTDTVVTALTRYEYRVRAYNSTGTSTYSNVAAAEVPAPPGGKLVVAKSLSFGVVRLGKTAERKLLLRNTDARNALTVNLGAVTGAGFVLPQGGLLTIPKRGKAQVVLRFTPPQKGKAQGTLSLRSSDPRKTQVSVKLIATGR